ncbi:MAG: glycosyltransferase family 2 protein [Eubacterium sp.]|jgi:glycosyltransferase involved in cell wall biosynthesis|nr:glycosyltransferase family 2 protein [Eubacterium sp.]
MIKDLVTVMIPCFNGETYLNKCFECLMNQDYKQVQLIVINDGSTDGSEKIILSYKEKIEKKGWQFLYLYQSNGGAAAAINNGLKSALGEYIMLYDVDDILYHDNISKKVKCFKADEELGVVLNNGYFLNEKNGTRNLFANDKEYIGKQGLFNALLFEHAYNWPGSYMVRAEMLFKQLNNKKIFISPYGQNLQILLPVAYFYKVEIIEQPLMDYLVRENSVSHTGDIHKQLELQKGFTLNRTGTIKLMKIEECVKKQLLTQIDIWNSRKCFIFAYNHGLVDEMKNMKNHLSQCSAFTKKDRIRYIVSKNSLLKKIYEGLHKIKNRSI